MKSLKERHDEYESKSSIIFPELPIVVRADLKNYKKFAELPSYPYNAELIDVMSHAMLFCASDIPNALLAYLHNKEITFILVPGENLWCQNDLQKISSIIASMLTVGFYKFRDLCHKECMMPEPIFSCKSFALPNMQEVLNHIILRQNLGHRFVINEVSINSLAKLYNKKTTFDILINRTDDEKISILKNICDVDFFQYPTSYINGVMLYKNTVTINTKSGDIPRNKWELNFNIPEFRVNKELLLKVVTLCQT